MPLSEYIELLQLSPSIDNELCRPRNPLARERSKGLRNILFPRHRRQSELGSSYRLDSFRLSHLY